MSGAIMPAPLAMPLIVTVTPPISAAAGRDLRIGVGGHDRLGGLEPEIAGRIRGQRVEHAGELGGVERLADHAGRGEEDLALAAADGCSGDFAVSAVASRPWRR
jgi:hypothetical protein